MKYYQISIPITKDGEVYARMNGVNVKGKEDFFRKNCGPRRFFDKMYDFNYLIPFEDEDEYGKVLTKSIHDYHGWAGTYPTGGGA
ncbi:MAG: hypothetical protein ACFHU9_00645 [Fluviicola sp.]